MSGRFAILCPGQGGQHGAMFDFLGVGERTRRLLREWSLDERLGAPAEQVLDDPVLPYKNRVAQPLIVAATLAAWESIREILPAPDLIAGYSVGELTAYAVAGSLSPLQALDLAMLRAGVMDDAAHGREQGLMAVSGLAPQRLHEALAGRDLFVAIRSGPESAIVGGTRAELLALATALDGEGVRTCVLRVDVASHTPLMRAAVAPVLSALRAGGFAQPAVPVLAGISGEPVRDAVTAMELLARQTSETVQWQACMRACREGGITAALELGPGAALSRMLRQQYPEIECRAIDDFRSVAGVEKWVARQLGC